MSSTPDQSERDIDDTLANLQNAKVGIVRVVLLFLFRQKVEVVLLVSFIGLMVGAAWIMAYDVIPNTFDKINNGYSEVADKNTEAAKIQAQASSENLDKVLRHADVRHAEFKEMLLELVRSKDKERNQPIAVNPLGAGT
jgi:hypothetical protein